MTLFPFLSLENERYGLALDYNEVLWRGVSETTPEDF